MSFDSATSPAERAAQPVLSPIFPVSFDLREPVLPSRAEVRNAEAEQEKEEVSNGRARLLRVAGLAYGAQAGLAAETAALREALLEQASLLDRTFDFSRVVLRPETLSPSGALVLPPVIVAAERPMEVQESGDVIRIADRRYEIAEPARFAVSVPDWRAYLLRDYDPPQPPPADVLPKTAAEREIWRKAVDEGWEAGVSQARRLLADDLARLERDYVGMIRYRRLAEDGRIGDVRMAFGQTPLVLDAEEVALRVGDVVGRIVEQSRWRTDRVARDAWQRGHWP